MLNSNLNKIIFSFICLLFFESRDIKAQSASICQGDSAVLRMNCSYFGTLQWQNSSDQATWSTITGATLDTLKVIPSLTTYYRASITSGTCNLVYSDTAVITVNTIPPAPSITVADSCGSSRLTAGNYTGTLLWSTGQTVNPITVSSAGTYTLTQIVNGCSSLIGSATTSPIIIPPAPTVAVIDNCGSSNLTANGFTGTLLWSNTQTVNPISVNSAGTYTVSQTVNGCSSTAGSGTASPTAIPSTANAGSDINLACGVNIVTLAGNTPIIGTGMWSIVSGTATITNPGSPTSGVTGLIEPGIVILRWTISNVPCASSIDDVDITVNSIPLAPTAGTATPTKTAIVWNWNTVSGAIGYKFNTLNDYSTATDNLGNLSYTQTGLTCNTAYTLYVWAYNSCGNSSVSTLTETTSACCTIPAAPTATGTTTCTGTAVTLTATAPGGIYQWYDAASGGTLIYTGASYTTPTLTANTTYYVQTTVDGCTSARTSVTVTISSCSGPPAQPSVITSFFGGGTTANPCVGCNKYYQVTDESCVSYTWSVPSGWNILSGQGTYRINVDIGTNSGTVSVTPSNGCGSGTAQSVSVDPTGDGYVFPANNAAGNLFVFSNYDGGTLNIDVDLNIPNIKIGVVSYAASQIIITGTYAANVVSVHWAGYTGSGTTITPSGIGTIAVLPAATLANPCGNGSIVCSYTCGYSNCGGCNAPDQIIAYFLNKFPASIFNFHRTHYGVWNSLEKLSTGINCPY